VSFFDEADEPAPPPRRSGRAPTGGGGPTDQQTLLVRRAIALGGGLLVFILLVLVVKGCLDSRKERSLKDYNRNVGALIQQDDEQVGKALFQQLSNPPTSALDLQTGLNQLRVASNDILSRAKKLDVPGDMKPAQFYLLTTLEFRRDAIGAIANKITAALGSSNSDEAIKQIAGQMQALLASDVVYSQRVYANIDKALNDNGIGGQHIQTSNFFTDFSWLAPQTVASKLGQSLSESAGGKATPGTHGFGLLSTAVGDQTLNTSGGNTVTATPDLAFTMKAQNQGENNETNVKFKITISGSGKPITAQRTVAQVQKGATVTVTVPLGKTPPIGTAVSVKAEVVPVLGEKKTDNNRQTYSVLFKR
jgi:hypothetical protein